MLSLQARENYETCLLPFWTGLVDDALGGFYGRVDHDLSRRKDAPKSVLQTSRILWFFSAAYLAYADEEALCYAQHAYKFLQGHCFDRENGGLYWTVNANGTPKENNKYTYNHAFAIYALATYYEATESHEALERAFELFQIIEDLCVDEIGYLEAFQPDFEPMENLLLSPVGISADRTVATPLHILEAYTELYRVSGDEHVESRLRFLLNQFETVFFNKDKQRLEIYFDKDYVPLAQQQSFGLDITASWLLDKACEVLGDLPLLRRTRAYTAQLAESVYNRAFKGHGLIYGDIAGQPDPRRVWWVQAEGIVGFINAYKYTSEEKYLDAANRIWAYVSTHMVDKRSGSEWLWELDVNNNVTPKPLADPWKCPYHNGRMCFELSRRGF